MSREKIKHIGEAVKQRQRLKEVAQALVEDAASIRIMLSRRLAPMVGHEVLDTLERMEQAARYWCLGEQEDVQPPIPAGGPVSARYNREMFGVLHVVNDRMTEGLAAESLTDKELVDLAMVLEIGAEHIRNYMAAVEIERQIRGVIHTQEEGE